MRILLSVLLMMSFSFFQTPKCFGSKRQLINAKTRSAKEIKHSENSFDPAALFRSYPRSNFAELNASMHLAILKRAATYFHKNTNISESWANALLKLPSLNDLFDEVAEEDESQLPSIVSFLFSHSFDNDVQLSSCGAILDRKGEGSVELIYVMYKACISNMNFANQLAFLKKIKDKKINLEAFALMEDVPLETIFTIIFDPELNADGGTPKSVREEMLTRLKEEAFKEENGKRFINLFAHLDHERRIDFLTVVKLWLNSLESNESKWFFDSLHHQFGMIAIGGGQEIVSRYLELLSLEREDYWKSLILHDELFTIVVFQNIALPTDKTLCKAMLSHLSPNYRSDVRFRFVIYLLNIVEPSDEDFAFHQLVSNFLQIYTPENSAAPLQIFRSYFNSKVTDTSEKIVLLKRMLNNKNCSGVSRKSFLELVRSFKVINFRRLLRINPSLFNSALFDVVAESEGNLNGLASLIKDGINDLNRDRLWALVSSMFLSMHDEGPVEKDKHKMAFLEATAMIIKTSSSLELQSHSKELIEILPMLERSLSGDNNTLTLNELALWTSILDAMMESKIDIPQAYKGRFYDICLKKKNLQQATRLFGHENFLALNTSETSSIRHAVQEISRSPVSQMQTFVAHALEENHRCLCCLRDSEEIAYGHRINSNPDCCERVCLDCRQDYVKHLIEQSNTFVPIGECNACSQAQQAVKLISPIAILALGATEAQYMLYSMNLSNTLMRKAGFIKNCSCGYQSLKDTEGWQFCPYCTKESLIQNKNALVPSPTSPERPCPTCGKLVFITEACTKVNNCPGCGKAFCTVRGKSEHYKGGALYNHKLRCYRVPGDINQKTGEVYTEYVPWVSPDDDLIFSTEDERQYYLTLYENLRQME